MRARRTFVFEYTVAIPAIRDRTQVWIPIARNDEFQRVGTPEIDGDGRVTEDPATGNRMLHAVLVPGGERVIKIRQRVERRSRHVPVPSEASYRDGELAGFSRYLKADAHIPLDPTLAAAAVGPDPRAPVTAAHQLFEHLLREFEYDRAGCTPDRADELGDLAVACDLRRGTCTEFHGLFTGAARALGIPTQFAFGFNVPAAPAGAIGGYHCWVEIFLPGAGWFPVDVTEAWKRRAAGDHAKAELYFGGLDENRVQFTTGRDVGLCPEARSGPVDRFIFPEVESDGDPVEVTPTFRFEACE